MKTTTLGLALLLMTGCHAARRPAPVVSRPAAPAAVVPRQQFAGGLLSLPSLAPSWVDEFLAGCSLPQGQPQEEDVFCQRQAEVRIVSARAVSQDFGPWRAGELGYVVVKIVTPTMNPYYTGVQASQSTAGIAPPSVRHQSSQGIGPEGIVLSLPFESSPDVPKGLRVPFHITVIPGDPASPEGSRCPWVHSIDHVATIE
jgi:hypothetical protein